MKLLAITALAVSAAIYTVGNAIDALTGFAVPVMSALN